MALRLHRRAVSAAASLALVLGACSDDDSSATDTSAGSTATSTAPTAAAATGSTSAGETVTTPGGSATTDEHAFAASLAEPGSSEGGVTYDPDAAPDGAELAVTVTQDKSSATFLLEVTGMQPDRGYAVHAHVNPCGDTGDAAGPHFQNEVDPAATPDAPSVDPAYANPKNEVWLDIMTDADGAGTSEATAPFVFNDEAPASIIVHAEMMTATARGEAGSAGDRLACLDMPLS